MFYDALLDLIARTVEFIHSVFDLFDGTVG